MYTVEDVSGVATFVTVRLPFSICTVFFVSKGNLSDFNYTNLAQVDRLKANSNGI